MSETDARATWRADPTKTFYFGMALGFGITLAVTAVLLAFFL